MGHAGYQCKLPVTSFGMIVFRTTGPEPEVLMIRRKDTFGFIDFMRGKYVPGHRAHLLHMLNEMTVDERHRLQTWSFAALWHSLWHAPHEVFVPSETDLVLGEMTHTYSEQTHSHHKFAQLKEGVTTPTQSTPIRLETVMEECTTHWLEPEWEFPKGRRNGQERELECALREFEEETGLSRQDVDVVDNVLPLEELFIGSNHKAYRHKFFLAQWSRRQSPSLLRFQPSEVSKMEWKTVSDAVACIRPYHEEKRRLVARVGRLVADAQWG
jgi:8-oxo-dGTP pyrophosphatase MutT (NUDIX family)